jgi:hypothetical protein
VTECVSIVSAVLLPGQSWHIAMSGFRSRKTKAAQRFARKRTRDDESDEEGPALPQNIAESSAEEDPSPTEPERPPSPKRAALELQAKSQRSATVDVSESEVYGDDAIARFQRRVAGHDEATRNAAMKAGEKVYRGADSYTDFRKRGSVQDATAAAKASGLIGPLRAPANVASVTAMDHQAGLCKDYFETGFCGFGDACIFLHDRSFRRAGWQQDRDWEEQQKRRKERQMRRDAGDDNVSEDSEEELTVGNMLSSRGDALRPGSGRHDDTGWKAVRDRLVHEDGRAGARPNAVVLGGSKASRAFEGSAEAQAPGVVPAECFICRDSPIVSPVAPPCGHVVCEACAIARHRADPESGCAVCGKPTQGIFNAVAGAKSQTSVVHDEDEWHVVD